MTTEVLMYDGINSLAAGIARDFPGAAKVAGYVNGTYAWSQAEWGLFPHADHVAISVTASANAGDVLDVETGDATPGQCAGWIAMRKAAGLFRPTVYCSRSVVPAIRAGTGSYVLGRDYDIWVAEYDGSPSPLVPPGTPPASYAAKQYESTPGYDVSAVYDPGWPHRHAPVAAGPAAPGGMSATPHETVSFAWDSTTAGLSYHWVLAHGTPAAVGAVVHEGNVTATGNVVHLSVDAGVPGPMCWRVQELPGGQWSVWRGLAG
jgi:hypothetical protein